MLSRDARAVVTASSVAVFLLSGALATTVAQTGGWPQTPPPATQSPVTGGIGVVLEQIQDGTVVIVGVAPGGPAAGAGLAAGDVILRVDGAAAAQFPLPDVARRISGAPGTPVALDLRRPTGQETRVTLVRAPLTQLPPGVQPPPGYQAPPGSPPAPGPPPPVAAPAMRAPAGGAPHAPTVTAVPPRATGEQLATVRLRPVSIVDQQGLGFEAYHVLAPVDWQAESAVVWWLPVNCANPAAPRARLFDPRGVEEVNVFPGRPFVWSQYGIPAHPPGSFYQGNEVQAPVDASQYVRQYLIPRFRTQLAQARVTGAQPLPEFAQAVAGAYEGVHSEASAARVSFEYEQQGRTVQEDVYAALVALHVTPGVVNWGTYATFSFKAEKGRLADRARLFSAMVASLAPDLRWYNRYLQLVDACTRATIDASNQALLRSQIMARTNDEINAIRREAYQTRQASQDRIHQKFSEHIRGVESYQNPFEGRRVELPSGYAHAWVNRSGEVILSNSASYNPNVGSNIQWQEMKK